MKKLAYSPGDRVVLPPYGLGVVSAISTRCVVGALLSYYQVEFPNTSSRAFVPVDAQGAGLRPALTAHDLPRLLARLQSGQMNLPRQWAARHRRVTEILVSGDPFEIASLTSELRRWHLDRGLPDLDRQAYRRALKLLEQEVRAIPDGEAPQVCRLLEGAWSETAN